MPVSMVAVMAVNLRLLGAWTLRQQQAAGTGSTPLRRCREKTPRQGLHAENSRA